MNEVTLKFEDRVAVVTGAAGNWPTMFSYPCARCYKNCWANNLKFSASCDIVHFNRFSTIINFTKL